MAKEAEVLEAEIVDEAILSLDEFDIDTKGALSQDIERDIVQFEMEEKNLPKIEVKEMVIKETGNFLNLKENVINIPIEMIVFPFFTPQKQNKRVNFKYSFQDLGVTMFCTLVTKDDDDKVFQPSIFEEKIYTYLISMYEMKGDINDTDEYIEFEISDFICGFLGNKMNRAYYTKVEQSLKNLKNTEYQFVVSNHSKLGKYKFEDEEFKLLTYKKLKIGKKVFYRVTLNKNIRKKIKDKRYIKYNSKRMLEIIDKDVIASRIYKYISKIRYGKEEDEIGLKTIAAIIPLKTEQIVSRENKRGEKRRYRLDRIKQVKKRVEKAYTVLSKLGYIKSFKFLDKDGEIKIRYIFNVEKDNECHISSYLDKSKPQVEYKGKWHDVNEKRKKEKIERIQREQSSQIKFIETPEIRLEFEERIKKAKQNIYVSKAWNKRALNKMERLLKQKGEVVVFEILDILYNQLKTEIKTTLVQYINGIVKNIEEQIRDQEEASAEAKLQLFQTVQEEIEIPEKVPELEKESKEMSIEEIEMAFSKLEDLEKVAIEQKALELCENKEKVSVDFLLKLKERSEAIYMSTIIRFIGEILLEKES